MLGQARGTFRNAAPGSCVRRKGSVMRPRGTAFIAIALLLVVATAAVAAGVLAVSPTSSVIAYPRPAKLIISTPAAVAETITVEAMPVGGAWTVIKTIPPSVAASSTTFTINPRVRVNSGFRVVQGAAASDVVTVSVRARLSPVRAIGRQRVHTLHGTISPAHAKGAVVGVHVWKVTGRGRNTTLTAEPDITGVVYRTNSQVSWWKATFAAPARGAYLIRAFHEDDGHVLSSSPRRSITIR